MAVPSVDVFFAVGEVPGFKDLVVLAQVAEGFVGVHFGEATIEDCNAYAFAIDAFGAKELALHTDDLVGEDGGVGCGSGVVGGDGVAADGGSLHRSSEGL